AQSQPSPKESKKTSFQPQPISGPVACKPHGTSLAITVKPPLKFSEKCLSAPANRPFTISLANHDNAKTEAFNAATTAAHNIAIYTNSSAQHNVFNGKVVQPKENATYHVKALPRGIYYFKCIVHPVMNGSFVSY
ncbi:MAG: hypothetical protein M3P18_21855, partial [Actinomycetota bacterium]|nr:hypothetical protein [Actinomycetota bacterium]